jgi:hypothetical protein
LVNDPRRISAREGACEVTLPVAAHMPSGASASSILIEARRMRPEKEVSRGGRSTSVTLCAATEIGSKVGDRGEPEEWWAAGETAS